MINNFITYLITLCALISIKASNAQQQLKLSDVARFELVIRDGGLSSNLREVHVKKENDVWKSYQTKLIISHSIDTLSRKVIRFIPSKTLNDFLELIAKPDTAKNLELFDINLTELTTYIDSIGINLTSAQRTEFIKAINTKAILQQALNKSITPFLMDDRTYYGITIVTKAHKRFTIHAYSFADLYYLPWIIKDKKSFNPRISTIFEFISGNEKFEVHEKQRLYRAIVKNISRTHFATRFTWDNFK